MSVQKYIVNTESSGFTSISNVVLQGLKKSSSALGLYVFLLSRPTDWIFRKKEIQNHFEDIGRDKLEKLLFILEKCNLIEIKQSRNDQGRFSDWSMLVKNGNDFSPFTENQESDNSPFTEKPYTENQSLVNSTYKEKKKKKRTKQRKDKSFYMERKTTQAISELVENRPCGFDGLKKKQDTKETKAQSKEFILPAWIDQNDWNDFVQLRKQLKVPLSAIAVTRIINTLKKLKDQGENISDVFNQTIINSWKGLFPIRKANNGAINANKRKSNSSIHFDSCKQSLEGTVYDQGYKPDEDPFREKMD